jgi:hypothetical protein
LSRGALFTTISLRRAERAFRPLAAARDGDASAILMRLVAAGR